MGSPVSFKVYYLDEIRRFTLHPCFNDDFDDSSVSYDHLVERIRAVFDIEPTLQLRLRWIDSDGDRIVFSSTEELTDAVRHLAQVQCRQDAALRIYATAKSADQPEARDGFDVGAIAHPGVCCDGCNTGIRGYRFKCLACPDYDLCLACLNRDVHNQHPMTLIRRPGDQVVGGGGWGGGWPGYHHMMRRIFMHQQQQQQQQQWRDTQASGCSDGARPRGDCQMRESQARTPPAAATVTSGAATAPPMTATATSTADVGNGLLVEQVTSAVSTVQLAAGIDASIQVMRHEADAGVQSQSPASAEAAIKMTPLTEARLVASTQVSVGSSSTATQASASFPLPQVESSGVVFRQELDTSTVSFGGGSGGGADSDGGGGFEIVGATASAATAAVAGVDPKIVRALEHMSAMGFNDEGGWLTRLLMAKDGDICAVLDAIRPAK